MCTNTGVLVIPFVFYFKLLENRQKEATKEETKQYAPVLNINYMSEDEDLSDGEGWQHLKLTWRADAATKFFYGLGYLQGTISFKTIGTDHHNMANVANTSIPPAPFSMLCSICHQI